MDRTIAYIGNGIDLIRKDRLRSILILCKQHRLTVISVRPRMSEFLHDIPNFEGSRDTLAGLFSFA